MTGTIKNQVLKTNIVETQEEGGINKKNVSRDYLLDNKYNNLYNTKSAL